MRDELDKRLSLLHRQYKGRCSSKSFGLVSLSIGLSEDSNSATT